MSGARPNPACSLGPEDGLGLTMDIWLQALETISGIGIDRWMVTHSRQPWLRCDSQTTHCVVDKPSHIIPRHTRSGEMLPLVRLLRAPGYAVDTAYFSRRKTVDDDTTIVLCCDRAASAAFDSGHLVGHDFCIQTPHLCSTDTRATSYIASSRYNNFLAKCCH